VQIVIIKSYKQYEKLIKSIIYSRIANQLFKFLISDSCDKNLTDNLRIKSSILVIRSIWNHCTSVIDSKVV